MKHWHFMALALCVTQASAAQQMKQSSQHTQLPSLAQLQTTSISASAPSSDSNKGSPASASTTVSAPNLDIKSTTLAQLMNIKITSLIGKEENLQNAAAAVYVITSDEIKRMGVTQLAETLRYAPGVQVARTGSNTWAISIRGFSGISSNKTLVTIDGRSVYTTLYSGVLWQEQDLLLDDIDRIEIIRGPGGVTWGTNAVNGVINFITKSSRDTQGVLVKGGAGTINQLGQARVGAKLADNTYGRAYAKASHEKSSTNIPMDDSARMYQSGFRIDRYSNSIGNVTLQGDIYQGGIGSDLLGFYVQRPANMYQYNGNNLLFNWFYNATSDQSHKVLAYVDNNNINSGGRITDHRNVLNLDYQIIQRWNIQELTWGIGTRKISDHVGIIPNFSPAFTTAQFIPPSKIDRLYTSFIQDDIGLFQNKAHFIIGTKYEHNNYTGTEWQPSVRTSYAFSETALLWGAWSRSLRIPTRIEEDLAVPPVVLNNRDLKAEGASTFELGWRKSWPVGLNWDMTAYTTKYINLIAAEFRPSPLRITQDNKMSGRISGIEFGPSFQIKPNWLVRFNYSYALAHMGVSNSSFAKNLANERENLLPRSMSQLVSMWDINDRWQLNAFLRYMGALRRGPSTLLLPVDSYTVADFSVEWKATKNVSWQLAARDLGKKHFEWGDRLISPLVAPSATLFLTITL